MRKTWHLWADHKQTYGEIAEVNLKNKYWVQNTLDQYILPAFGITSLPPQKTCICMDVTHFGSISVMVFRSPELGVNLYAKIVLTETIQEYQSGLAELTKHGWTIKAIISDGKGLKYDYGYPVQMCQFHQIQIITRYLTKRPRLEANIELRKLTLKLTRTDMESFSGWLYDWHQKNKDFLREAVMDERTGRRRFVHRRTRSAYRSLKTNLPYLFTFQKHIGLNIPNTNNSLEGYFSSLKKKVNIHNGLRRDRKIKLIFYLLIRSKNPQEK